MVRSDMAQKAFNMKVEVLDMLIQEVQELADLYVRYLESVDTNAANGREMGDLLQALAKTYLGFRHAIATVSASVTAAGGLEVRADWDF